MERHLVWLAIAVLLLVSACSGHSNLALQNARSAYELAAQDPGARTNAAATLDDARRYLNRAQALFEKRAEPTRVEYYAVLARTYADAARSLGKPAPVSNAPERPHNAAPGFTRQNVSKTNALAAADAYPINTMMPH